MLPYKHRCIHEQLAKYLDEQKDKLKAAGLDFGDIEVSLYAYYRLKGLTSMQALRAMDDDLGGPTEIDLNVKGMHL